MKKWGLLTLLACFFGVSVYGQNVAKIEVEGEAAQYATSLSDLNTKIAALTDNTQAVVTLLRNIVGEGGDLNNVTLTIPANKDIVLNLAGYGIKQNWTIITPEHTLVWNTDEYTMEAINSALTDYEVSGYTPEQAYNYSNPWLGYALRKYVKCGDCDGEDINYNSLIYNIGKLRIISEGNGIVQMITSGSDEGQATTICNAGDITIEGGTFIGPTPYIVNGTVKMPVLFNKTISETPKVTISGGVFLCDESQSDYQWGSYFPVIVGVADWTITGGIFSEDEQVKNLKHPSTKDYINTNNSENATYEAVLVPYSNSDIKGYNVKDRKNYVHGVGTGTNQYLDTIKAVCAILPKTRVALASATASTAVEVAKGTSASVSSSQNAKLLYVDTAATCTIPSSATLHVGDGGVILGGKDSKIIIEKGGTLIVDNDIITSSHKNIELTMDEINGQYAKLLIKAEKIQGSHPNATVKLLAKNKNKGDGTYLWQRFAVPTYAENFKFDSIKYNNSSYPTAFYKWGSEGWEVIPVASKATTNTKPFTGYIMTTSATSVPAEGIPYTFKCELVGNGNPNVDLALGWNYLANSYTAPMSLKAWLEDLVEHFDGVIDANVWVQKPGSANRWMDIALADVPSLTGERANLQPMQAFIYHTSAAETVPLKYTEYVYTPFMNGNSAPRRMAADAEYQMAVIELQDANGDEDEIKLYEGEQFSDAFDNGYDVVKHMDEDVFNVYFSSATLGDLSRLASNNVDNASISVKIEEAGEYTFSFSGVTLEQYALLDAETNTKTEITNGGSYSFTSAANQLYEGRFSIVKLDGGDETSIEDTKAVKNNGIYSLTGVYMGTNINALPAGIYVVNGQKVVK